MTLVDENEYQKHMASLVSEGFILDPRGYKRLSLWTDVLMHLLNARANFEWVRDHKIERGDLNKQLDHLEAQVGKTIALD